MATWTSTKSTPVTGRAKEARYGLSVHSQHRECVTELYLIPDLWLLSALTKMRLWFLWELGQIMQVKLIIRPNSHKNQSLILAESANRSHTSEVEDTAE